MNRLCNFKNVVILALAFIFIFTKSAQAYIDAGTGSYILQLLIGALVGIIFTLKIYWRNLKTYLSKLFTKNKKISQDEN